MHDGFASVPLGYRRGVKASNREQRHARRWVSRIAIGGVIGFAVGVVVGAIWGSIAYRAGSFAMWAVVAACAIFLGIFGAFVGGLAGLESPDPGHEPSQVDEPLREPGELTGPERGDDTMRG